jgi:ABC-type uncharacterized transport system substrate-binding protein
MQRRAFIKAVAGSAISWPFAAGAQPTETPVVGVLATASVEENITRLNAFREGLSTTGYVEGHNVRIEYRWAEAHSGRLPELAAQLVRQRVAVLVSAGGAAAALAAKAATGTIPIVFATAADPIGLGLVATLSRPGGNVTGVTSLNEEIVPKRLQLLHELLPSATRMALLVNPAVPALAEPAALLSRAAADSAGLQLDVLHASSEREFDAVFDNLSQLHANALAIAPDTLFTAKSDQLAALTVRHRLPAVYESRRFVAAGGLMGYGSNETEYYRLLGTYTGRVLKGEKPADLPVQQSTKVELIVNAKTAKAMGIAVPLSLLGRADEVIE